MRKRLLMTMMVATMALATACGGKDSGGKSNTGANNTQQGVEETGGEAGEEKSKFKIEGNVIREEKGILRLYDTGYLEIINEENREIYIKSGSDGYKLLEEIDFDKLVINAGTLVQFDEIRGKNIELYIVDDGAIGAGACYKNQAITKVYIDSATEIGANTFYLCNNLKEAYIGGNVTKIGQEAFRDCEGLEKVSLNEGLEDIEAEAFYSCRALKDFTLPKTLKTIGDDAFYWTLIEEVEIPAGVERVNGFKQCTELSKVVFNEGLTVIEEGAFWNCRQIKELVFPKTLTEIQYSAFGDCMGIEKITFADSATLIKENAFLTCNSLTTINFPETLVGIEFGAFDGCYALEKVTLPKSLESKVDANAFNGFCTEVVYE